MSANSAYPISTRASRLNSLILNRPESLSKDQKEICRAINREGLLDTMFLLYDECNKDALKKKNKIICEFATKYRPIIRETKQLRVGIDDFDIKSQIGNGYFGDVHLVTEKSTRDVYAMKTIKKACVANCQFREERDIMVLGRKSEWITRLQYAFQDRENLYLIMEYLPGGDLLGLMIRHGSFDEELARFYLAEIALALNALHSFGYVHRDVKPENLLLDRCGHLKLADFGSSIELSEDGSFVSISPVGTPDYVAPELLSILSTKGNQTTQKLDVSCDYWSMGIIGYEMIIEKTPFHNDNVFDTYNVIQNYSDDKRIMEVLEFPNDIRMSKNLKDLLNGLITKKSRRMDFDEITDHPFFNGINWRSLRDQVPPIIPTLSGEDDTSNFDDVDKSQKRSPVLKKSVYMPINTCEFSGEDLQFLGYTYVYEETSKFLKATPKSSTAASSETKMSSKINDLQTTIKEQMKEIKMLQKDVFCAEKKAEQMDSLEKIHNDTKVSLESLKTELKEKIMELAACKKEIKTLKSSLKVEEEMRQKSNASTAEIMQQTYSKWEKVKEKSDENFIKQINERKSEVAVLKERIRAHEIELDEKNSELQRLNSSLEKYKSMLKTAKDQISSDKIDYEDVCKKLNENYEFKVQDLKTRLVAESQLKSDHEKTIKKLRKELNDASDGSKSLSEMHEKLENELKATRKQLGKEMDETNRLTKEKKDLERQVSEANQKNDELRKEILKLQEESIKRQFKLSKMVTQSIEIAGSVNLRASNEGEFLSAHGSLTELNSTDAEELKSDLARARENEDIQRRRADDLEQVVAKLEKVVMKLDATADQTVGGILEKRNEKLEGELAAAKQEIIIDKQQNRSTYMNLYKLEKEFSDLKHEKNMLSRRLETANEKCSNALLEKQSLELKIKQQLDEISSKESSIIDLQKDIRNHKYELKQEREKWGSMQRDRLAEKTEIIEKATKIKSLEEKFRESSNKVRVLELKVSQLTDEKEILQRRLNDEKSQRSTAEDTINELSNNLQQKSKNYELLKEAAATVENQLNIFEDMLGKEVNHNKENVKKIDDLWTKLRNRDEEISKLKRELGQEKTLKMSAESNKCQLQNELDELKEEMQSIQMRMLDLQNQLVKKQEVLYEAQENIEITSSDLQHLQKLKSNYENEILILKEETTRILTDLYRSKEEAKKLSMELKDARYEIDEQNQEKDHLNTLLNELRAHSKERDVRTEATVSQQKKLIDYLTQRVEELQSKKKRGIAEVLFGASTPHPPQTPKSARKENIPANQQQLINENSNSKLRKAEEDLRRERERNQRLKENLMQTKMEIRKSASMKSPTRESTVETLSIAPSAPPEDSVKTIKATIHAEPSVRLQNENFQRDSSASPKAHHFAMTIETSSPSPNIPPTSCLACDKFILVGQPYWQCKECKLSVHRKCRGMVKSACLLYDGAMTSSETTSSTATIDGGSKKIQLDDVDGIKAFDDSSSIGSGSDLVMNYNGDHILCSSRFGLGWVMTSTPKINAVYELTKNVILFGCSNGLYSYHIDDNKIVQIKGITNVNYFSIKPNLTKSILIGDSGENLYECDLRVLMNKSHQSGLLEPKLNIQVIDLSIANRCSDEKWHMVELHGNTEHLNDAIAIAATSSRMVILKYDVKIGRFKPVRSLDTVRAITDILFTQHSAIVACDKFFEIDLNSYVAEEFLDMSEPTLRPTKNSRPMSVFRINSREFLLCFEDFGIFVDEYGLRAREDNILWMHEPKDFFYKNFLLYIIHDQYIQILKISNSAKQHKADSMTDFSQSRTFLTIDGDKKFTHNGATDPYVVNILKNSRNENGYNLQDLIQIDAEKVFKINLNRSLTSLISESNTSLATFSYTSSGADTIN